MPGPWSRRITIEVNYHLPQAPWRWVLIKVGVWMLKLANNSLLEGPIHKPEIVEPPETT